MSNNKLMSYSREVIPMLQAKAYQQELLKDFKETDERALELAEAIKAAQDELKAYLESNETSKEYLDKIKEIDNDVKQAVKAAKHIMEGKYSVKDLKAFFVARYKETVEEVVTKGDTFKQLEQELT